MWSQLVCGNCCCGEMNLPCPCLLLLVQAGAMATWVVEEGAQLLTQKWGGEERTSEHIYFSSVEFSVVW